MKLKNEPIDIIKKIYIISCAFIVFFFLFSNIKRIGGVTIRYAKKYFEMEEDVPNKLIIKNFPSEFEDRFAKEFVQRKKLTYFHDNLFFRFFSESYSDHFYLQAPKETQSAFLSSHPSLNKNRYNLFFDVLQGGFGDIDERIDDAQKQLLSHEAFLKDSSVPTAIVFFPTKHYLEFDKVPGFVKKSLADGVYKNPIQERIYYSLPKEFREKYIVNLFPEAIEANEETPLFPQHNFHWTERSHYTNITAAKIARSFGVENANPVPIDEYELEYMTSDIIHLTNINIQDTPFLKLSKEKFIDKGVQNIPSPYDVSHNINPNRTGKLVVFGDSFAEPFGKDLSLYFNEVWTFGNLEFNRKNVLFAQNEFKADYMLFISHQGLFTVSGTIQGYIDLLNESE